MYSIAVVLVSPVIGTIQSKVGYKNLISMGLVLMGCSIIPIGFLKNVENDYMAVAMGIFLRTLQGTASASINATCFGMAATKYANDTFFVVGMLEAMSGIGLVFGLLGGSGIYEAMGYKAVFIVFGGILPVLAVLSRFMFSWIESRQSAQEEGEQQRLLEENGPN